MTLLDANSLLHAYDADAPQHEPARRWVDELFAGDEWIGLPWLTLWAFQHIATHPRLCPRPVAAEEAFQILDGCLRLPRVRVVEPGPRHTELLRDLVVGNQATGASLTDAALAARAFEHGAVLASTDRDFSRFPNLRWVHPLEPKAR